MIRTIHLGGEVKHLLNSPIKLSANNLPQLIAALESQVPEFRAAALKYKTWMVVLTDENGNASQLTEDNQDLGWSKNKTHIYLAPNIEGAGIEASLVAFLVSAGASTAVAATVATIIINVGVSLVLGAISSMLAPKPKTGKDTAREDSFLFNGAVNVEGQGGPVPLVFGVHMCGSNVISSETFVEEMIKTVEKVPEPVSKPGQPTPPAPPYEDRYA